MIIKKIKKKKKNSLQIWKYFLKQHEFNDFYILKNTKKVAQNPIQIVLGYVKLDIFIMKIIRNTNKEKHDCYSHSQVGLYLDPQFTLL